MAKFEALCCWALVALLGRFCEIDKHALLVLTAKIGIDWSDRSTRAVWPVGHCSLPGRGPTGLTGLGGIECN